MLKGLFWLFGLIATPALAVTGGMDSGGGGLRGYESNPWFIGDREVTYCVEVNPHFPDASTSGIRNTVKNAFVEWRRFLELYRFNQRSFNFSFPDHQARNLNLRYVDVDSCESANLRVMIGVTDDRVRNILNNYPPKTFAFAHLTSDYDFKNYTRDNRGVIWIAQPELYSGQLFPPYNRRPILPLVLLHEIGHTLGIGHLDKYSIMSGDIFELMSVAEDDESIRDMLKKFAYIDNPTPLISFGRTTNWVPTDGGEQRQIQPLFKELTGRDSVGHIDFSLVTIPPDDVASLNQKGLITVRDQNGSYKIRVQFSVGSQSTWPYCKVKLAWEGVSPAEPRNIRTHGCLDSLSSDYLGGTVLNDDGTPIPSKITIGTRQKILTAFGGAVRNTRFNIHLKMVGASE